MNGTEQTEMMAKLSSSADNAWQPTELGGFKVGEPVKLSGIDTLFEIVRLNDPLVVLRAPSGRELTAGWRALTRVRRKRR